MVFQQHRALSIIDTGVKVSLIPRPSSLVEEKRGRGRPDRIYHVTDITNCGHFHEHGTHSECANT
jgi:hypothetical protein